MKIAKSVVPRTWARSAVSRSTQRVETRASCLNFSPSFCAASGPMPSSPRTAHPRRMISTRTFLSFSPLILPRMITCRAYFRQITALRSMAVVLVGQFQDAVCHVQQLAIVVVEQAAQLMLDPVGSMVAERLSNHQIALQVTFVHGLAAPIIHRNRVPCMMTIAVAVRVAVAITVAVGVSKRRMLQHELKSADHRRHRIQLDHRLGDPLVQHLHVDDGFPMSAQ